MMRCAMNEWIAKSGAQSMQASGLVRVCGGGGSPPFEELPFMCQLHTTVGSISAAGFSIASTHSNRGNLL